MPQDHVNSRTNSQTNKSMAANNNTGGISMPAVSPPASLLPQQGVAQLMKLKSNALKKTIDTKTETDVDLLLSFREVFDAVNKTKAVEAIDERLQELDPFLGFKQAIPGQVPDHTTDKDITRLSKSTKSSKKQGQDFKKMEIAHKFTPLTKPSGNMSKVPRVKVDKLTSWKGQKLRLRWMPELRGATPVEVPHVLCVYTMEWIRAEDADMDHVIPTMKLKQHLWNIAAKMESTPGYSKGVEHWLKEKGLNIDHWFMQKGSKWLPTQWAMFELHNNPQNLVFSSKAFNQIAKNAKDTMTLLKENPWFAEDFFNETNFNAAVNEGIGTVEGTGIATSIETFLLDSFPQTITKLGDEKEGERMMVKSIKLGALGKLSDKERKALGRKSTVRNRMVKLDDDDPSSGSDSDKDEKESMEKGLRWLIDDEQLNEQFPSPAKLKEVEKSKAKHKRRSQKRKSLLKTEQAKVEKLEKEAESKDQKIDRLEKEVESLKRRHSDSQVGSAKKPRPANVKLTERYKQLDVLLEEGYDTNRQRISPMRKDYNSVEAFINAFESHLQYQYGFVDWRNWKQKNPGKWGEARTCLAAIYEQRT